MKQHVYQLILLTTLVVIVGLVFRNQDFLFVKKVQNEIEESSPLQATTTEEPREILFRNIKPLDLQPTTEQISFEGPRVIVSNGVVRNPDYFYSLPGTSTEVTEVDTFINQASSTGALVKYSTSTGAITVVTSGFAPKEKEDVLDKVYVDKTNKIAFMVDSSWKVSSKIGLVSIQNVGFNGRNKILLTVTKNSVVKTADKTYGDFVLSYDLENKTWIGTSNTNSDLTPISPELYTKNGDAVFTGTTKVITKIVSFGPSDYVIVNISGTDDPKVIHKFVNSLSKLE